MLIKKLGYQFKQIALLKEALQHRSVGTLNNERLEFLGDSILNCIISEKLFAQFPSATEGQLTRLRASLVKGDTLAELAKELDLPQFIKLGPGELKSGGFRRPSILADCLEAIIAAIFLDAGIETCKTCVLKWYAHRLEAIDLKAIIMDAKTELQEFLQSKRLPLPIYHVVSTAGEPHDQTFKISCTLQHNNVITEGEGSSRRKAEQAAAAKALEQIR